MFYMFQVIVHVLDMQTFKPLKKRFTAKSMFMLHIANCYEDASGNIVLDFPAYQNSSVLHDLYIEKLRVNSTGTRHRCLFGFCELTLHATTFTLHTSCYSFHTPRFKLLHSHFTLLLSHSTFHTTPCLFYVIVVGLGAKSTFILKE